MIRAKLFYLSIPFLNPGAFLRFHAFVGKMGKNCV